ncbi:hypothetical protein V2J09_019211 [Rumex salicifolius]
MAKLPPRAPTMAAQDLSWRVFQSPPIVAFDSTPSWIHGDFVDFSAARRRAHRQTVVGGGGGEFEDDARVIMSMFNNEPIKDIDAGEGSINSLSSSGNASTSQEKRNRQGKPPGVKIEHDEVESATCDKDECRPDVLGDFAAEGTTTVSPPAGSHETASDPKRVKRILANRQSARRSRVRKLQYISELERNLTTLQREVSMLSPRVAYLDHQRMILNEDNSNLKTKIAALAQDNIFKDAHQEALKREIERLKEVYVQQQNIKASSQPAPPA